MSIELEINNSTTSRALTLGALNKAATIRRPVITSAASTTDPLAGITVTEEYLRVKELLESGCQIIFVSGKAGTGKSTLIHYLRHSYRGNIVVVAPTGVAALNVGGVTIHSYFQLPPRIITPDDIKTVRDRKLYSRLDLLIVDEISMVRADIVDAMDAFLRLNGRSKDLPFGGTQILLVGDLFQLPPVVTRQDGELLDKMGYASPYFFSAKTPEKCRVSTVELTTIFRQRDSEFANMLNSIRVAENLQTIIPRINDACANKGGSDAIIKLSCTNAIADQHNSTRLRQLPGEPQVYQGVITGKFTVEEERLPSPINLELKVGAQVMFTKNDELRRWVNGSLGRVVELSDTNIKVELFTETEGNVHDVQPVVWESYRYEYDDFLDIIVPVVAGRYVQYPLMLAWSVTIHKAQGKTLEKVEVDLGSGAFAPGQVYVALSRCRSMADITLSRPIRAQEVKCDPTIVRFYRALGGNN